MKRLYSEPRNWFFLIHTTKPYQFDLYYVFDWKKETMKILYLKPWKWYFRFIPWTGGGLKTFETMKPHRFLYDSLKKWLSRKNRFHGEGSESIRFHGLFLGKTRFHGLWLRKEGIHGEESLLDSVSWYERGLFFFKPWKGGPARVENHETLLR